MKFRLIRDHNKKKFKIVTVIREFFKNQKNRFRKVKNGRILGGKKKINKKDTD